MPAPFSKSLLIKAVSPLRAASCKLPHGVALDFDLIGLSASLCGGGPLIGSLPDCVAGLSPLLLVDASFPVVS